MCNDSVVNNKLKAHDKAIEKLQNKTEAIQNEQIRHEDALNDLQKSIEGINERLEKICDVLQDMAMKPARDYDAIKAKLAWAVIAALGSAGVTQVIMTAASHAG